MQINNFLMLKICIIILFSVFYGCVKDNASDNKPVSTWDNCSHKVAKDINYRLGIWEQQIPKKNPSMDKIIFINDSILEIYDNKGKYVTDNNKVPIKGIKYRFDSCNWFSHYIYWRPILPNDAEYWPYRTSYNDKTNEWYLIEKERFPSTGVEPGWDTFRFKKQ
ncbi:MAG: hypothetical protein MUF43_07570 [Flavobacterium sp.]|jgi:hypothetical protein|nr:hypothetical protein [Flavobacterium sp.]